MRTVVIDCQILQTVARSRGMGHYLRGFLQHLPGKSVRTILLVNPRLPELSSGDARLLSEIADEVVECALVTDKDRSEFSAAAATNRKLLDRALARYSATDSSHAPYFIVASHFYRGIHPVFPSSGFVNVSIAYDLIPFLFPDDHLRPGSHELRDYANRFAEFARADHYLAISQATADDLAVHLGIDQTRISVVLGGGSPRSHLEGRMPAALEGVHDFVLMATADLSHKNNERGVRAFRQADAGDMALVITSTFAAEACQRLGRLAKRVIFTGNVDDVEYRWLLDNARMLFFPTISEGLGLPVLEAVEHGLPVACSRIPSLVEISETAFTMFDPTSVTDMARAINATLDHPPANDELARTREAVLQNFSWDRTASRIVDALGSAQQAQKRGRLAVMAPAPSSFSAVGKVVQEMHAELSRVFEVDYYLETGIGLSRPVRPDLLTPLPNTYPASQLAGRRDRYDAVLTHIGNSEFHIDTILESLRRGGNAIIHDTHLTAVFDFMQREGVLTEERCTLERLIDEKLENTASSRITTLARRQDRLLCYSDYAAEAVSAVSGDPRRVTRVYQPVGVPERVTRSKSSSGITVSFAGIIHSTKGLDLARTVSEIPNVSVHVFGHSVFADSALLEPLTSVAEVVSDPSDLEFQMALCNTDILVNVRAEYHGETSRSVLEAMRYGVVVVVRRIGWYDELPDDTVVKVDHASEVADVVASLAGDEQRRREIGKRARRFLLDHHSYARHASTLADLLLG